jgi:3',5'-nucleoside bisphosphate phosphatase
MRGSPFTQLCRSVAALRSPARADLHVHSTFSDGSYSPEDIVHRAVHAKLRAVALTDHDTTAGIAATQMAAKGLIEIVPGVEITSEFRGVEIHLLGYFIDASNSELATALQLLRDDRRRRIAELATKIGAAEFEATIADIPYAVALGRRHLARHLIATGRCSSMHNAFTRCFATPEAATVFKRKLPAADGIAVIRGAGGVASWAHPPKHIDVEALRELRAIGLQAVECVYPWSSGTHGKRLELMANELNLAVTGGSDSHDPFPVTRAIGTRAISERQLDRIRELANR